MNDKDEVEIYGKAAFAVGALFAVAYVLTAAVVFLPIHHAAVYFMKYYSISTLGFMSIGAGAYIALEHLWEVVDSWIFDNVAMKVAEKQKEKSE